MTVFVERNGYERLNKLKRFEKTVVNHWVATRKQPAYQGPLVSLYELINKVTTNGTPSIKSKDLTITLRVFSKERKVTVFGNIYGV